MGELSYVIGAVLVGLGVGVLAIVLFYAYRELRMYRSTYRACRAGLSRHTALLRARYAALRVAFAQRFGSGAGRA